jgi:hypothetical protein
MMAVRLSSLVLDPTKGSQSVANERRSIDGFVDNGLAGDYLINRNVVGV